MSKTFKIILIVVAALVVLIQFIPVHRPVALEKQPSDLMHFIEMDEQVDNLLVAACYDCHSMETRYPWYAYVAPVSWLVARDVRIGRDHLNFSEWAQLEREQQIAALDEMIEEVEDGTMPMAIYTLTHQEAKLSREEREVLISWLDETADKLFDQ